MTVILLEVYTKSLGSQPKLWTRAPHLSFTALLFSYVWALDAMPWGICNFGTMYSYAIEYSKFLNVIDIVSFVELEFGLKRAPNTCCSIHGA